MRKPLTVLFCHLLLLGYFFRNLQGVKSQGGNFSCLGEKNALIKSDTEGLTVKYKRILLAHPSLNSLPLPSSKMQAKHATSSLLFGCCENVPNFSYLAYRKWVFRLPKKWVCQQHRSDDMVSLRIHDSISRESHFYHGSINIAVHKEVFFML